MEHIVTLFPKQAWGLSGDIKMSKLKNLIAKREELMKKRNSLIVSLDKENFENRIEWVKNNINYLEDYTDKADEPILYAKAVRALRKALSGKPVNHAVALDASCSGLSIMSAVMRCKNGAYLTGLIDPDNRVDGYTVLNQKINELVGNLTIARKDSKRAIMTLI